MTQRLELLQQTFTCDRFGLIPVRGCLRRQVDRQESTKAGELGPPRRPFCADECGAGAVYRAAARSDGIPMEPCPACGSALIGPDAHPCATCAARRLDAGKDVPRGALPPPAAPSSRIWTGEVPDVPFTPPGAHRSGRPSAALLEAREARAAERRQAFEQQQDHQEEPAEPAEEERMACKECGSKTCHKGWCTCRPGGALKGATKGPGAVKAPSGKPAKSETKAEAQQRLERTVAVVQAGRTLKARPGPAPVSVQPDLTLYPDDALIDLRRLVEAEIRDRLVAREAAVASLRDALGRSAGRTEAA